MSVAPAIDMKVGKKALNPWIYVATGFIALIFGVNTLSIIFNILTPSLSHEFGWNRLQISSGLTIYTVFNGFGYLALGFLLPKYGIRRVGIPLGLLFGVGIGALSQTSNNLQKLYVICALAGFGSSAATASIYAVVITAWFRNNRGLALGILNLGFGLCGTITPFIISHILGEFGWRAVFLVMGLIGAVLPAIAYGAVLRLPDAWGEQKGDGPHQKVSMKAVLRQRYFWLLCLAILLVSSSTYGMLSQTMSMTADKGIGIPIALTILSTISLSSMGSRLVIGALLDRIFAPFVATGIFIFCAIGVILLGFSHDLTMLYVGAVFIGLGLGAEGDIIAYIVSRYVPNSAYSRVFAILMFLYAQGGSLGIFALSSSFTITGAYTTALIAIVAAVVISIVVFLCLGSYKYETDGSEVNAK